MTIKQLDVLGGDLAEPAWKLYDDAFRRLNRFAAQRHLMFRAEFDQVMTDPRVTKSLTLDDAGQLAGLATVTNDLDAVPLIAPPFFERRWPVHYAQHRIWYVGFVAVAEAARPHGAFAEFFEDLYQIVAPADGLVALDICSHNMDELHLDRAIRVRLLRLSGGKSRHEQVDTQAFHVFDVTGKYLGAPAEVPA